LVAPYTKYVIMYMHLLFLRIMCSKFHLDYLKTLKGVYYTKLYCVYIIIYIRISKSATLELLGDHFLLCSLQTILYSTYID